MKKQFLLMGLLASSFAMAQKKAPVEKFASVISPKELKAKLTVLAAADMEGRETAMPGQKKAASYIESFFKKIGLQPGAADGKYQMPYPVFQDSLSKSEVSLDNQALTFGTDYALNISALANGNWAVDNVVFAGYGWQDSTHNSYENLDVKDKWVVVLEGLPKDIQAHPYEIYRSTFNKINIAKKLGVAGIIVVMNRLQNHSAKGLKGNMYIKENKGVATPLIQVSDALANKILHTSGKSIDELSAIKTGDYATNLHVELEKITNHLESSNVIGVLPGTDKKGEYVFVTGHYDHLGKRDSVIYFGADDDGSGTTSVMQLAQAFVNAKKKGFGPRRTMIFMTVSGEEKGLFGSEYYSEHPTINLDSASVDLNIDMDGRIDTERKMPDSTNYIYVIGHDKLSSDLQKINEAENNKYTHLVLDYKFDDPKDPNRIYYRSDHYNFAKKGIPILFFYDGMLKADYHQPSDTVDKIDFELMSKRAKMVFYTAWDIANRDAMLVRDIPLN